MVECKIGDFGLQAFFLYRKGIIMDGFMDKLTQRMSAQEMILANAAAEAKELELLKGQVEAYDELFKKMQEAGEINSANVIQLQSLLAQYQSKLDELQEHVTPDNFVDVEKISSLLQHTRNQIEEFSHRENVKVYRNVQAAVNDELNKKVQELMAHQAVIKEQNDAMEKKLAEIADTLGTVNEKLIRQGKKTSATLMFGILSFIEVTACLAYIILHVLGMI